MIVDTILSLNVQMLMPIRGDNRTNAVALHTRMRPKKAETQVNYEDDNRTRPAPLAEEKDRN